MRQSAGGRPSEKPSSERPSHWRFLLDPGRIEWEDGIRGPVSIDAGSVSDPVVRKEDGQWLYTFASSVDDGEMGVTDVVRGEDHVTNTGIQVDIWAALGGRPDRVRFAHLPLLMDQEGGKLSKRFSSLTLRSLRHDGIEPVALAGYIARLGTSDDPAPLPMDELAKSFALSHVSHSATRFDGRQLLSLNRRVLHALPFEAVRDRLPPGATAAFWNVVRSNLDLLGEARGWWDVVAGAIVPPMIEGEADYLRTALDALPPEPWDDAAWITWTNALRTATGRRGKPLFLPLRLALTGEDHGPEMQALLPLIGRDRATARLRLALG